MTRSIPEKDWKYLRSIEAELLSDLCRRIKATPANQAQKKKTAIGMPRRPFLHLPSLTLSRYFLTKSGFANE